VPGRRSQHTYFARLCARPCESRHVRQTCQADMSGRHVRQTCHALWLCHRMSHLSTDAIDAVRAIPRRVPTHVHRSSASRSSTAPAFVAAFSGPKLKRNCSSCPPSGPPNTNPSSARRPVNAACSAHCSCRRATSECGSRSSVASSFMSTGGYVSASSVD
jgi:hypothetical protein